MFFWHRQSEINLLCGNFGAATEHFTIIQITSQTLHNNEYKLR